MYNILMSVEFTWDPKKNRENIRKHGVSFEKAMTIFENFPLQVYYDPGHSTDDERYIAIGFSLRARILLVVHCENKKGTVVRIISARKATRKERRALLGGRR